MESSGFLERAMGIELHPKFLSLTETRCYPPLCESIVVKMLPNLILQLSGKPTYGK
jgi:hypothetical protein